MTNNLTMGHRGGVDDRNKVREFVNRHFIRSYVQFLNGYNPWGVHLKLRLGTT